ncbi:PD40 domain-containing protein [Cytobacillus suaedae]|nr:PD40 domain-containing protein [Cytobacillus suaedae]
MYIPGNQLMKSFTNQMKRSQTNIQKNIEKLATGQRIKAASNDAAGLAISQKLSALSRGSNQALRNVQDASAMVQVADGAMQEMTDILQRIRELTIQSMNGTNSEIKGTIHTNADTLVIQNEVDELKKELNKIVEHTEFNNTKLLTNKEYGEYLYENRITTKTIQLSQISQTNYVDVENNNVGSNTLSPVTLTHNQNRVFSPTVLSTISQPESYIGTTVMDHLPRWSSDGSSIIFTSNRDSQNYTLLADGSVDPALDSGTSIVSQQTLSSNGLMRLRNVDSVLYLEKRSSVYGSWTSVQSYSYNYPNDNNGGYSFSPKVDSSGNTSFVYSDNQGNLKKVDVNINTFSVSSPVDLISTTDTLNVTTTNNTINLPSSPNLYNMNTMNTSLRIEKVNDSGSRILTFWDGIGVAPTEGYYTVSGRTVTFFNDAIIGSESLDDAQDYYRFSYTSDGVGDKVYTTSIPTNAEIYNMHGEDGPRSLSIFVGGTEVQRNQLLSTQPSDHDSVTGVYVNTSTGKIEFYGDLRPAYNENVTIKNLNYDADGRNQTYSVSLGTAIDTYNLSSSDPLANRSIRVSIDNNTVPYDESKVDGYYYDPSNGRISFYGSYRPDLPSNPSIKIEYVTDNSYSSTSRDVYGIPLSYNYPEVYNLGSQTAPNSIRVLRNGSEEIAYSAENGYQYNANTNTIELYGISRPNVGDTYTIQMIAATSSIKQLDGKVEVPLYHSPETYGVTDPSIPSTFLVKVDGNEVNYDSTKTNGYFYNSGTNTIEIYGDARPEAKDSSNPDVQVFYVYESPSTSVGNDSYDIRLDSRTLDYGLVNPDEPTAISVYYKGTEVPYNEQNGFTYNSSNNQLSLHGTYRPENVDSTGDYSVFFVTANDLQTTVPTNSYIYKVEMNGQEIQRAQNSSGDGYIYNGQTIEIVGGARPDITNNTSQIQLNVQYFDSLDIQLNDHMPNDYFHNYCNHEAGADLLESEIDPTALMVSLNGSLLTAEQYSLQDNRIVLKQETLDLTQGSHSLSVDYRVRQGIGYQPNGFTYQTGANSGQSLKVEFASFDNMLRGTNVICVRNYEDAEQGLKVIDHALDFVLSELGNVGAVENRLDHIAANLANSHENTSASLSRIEDTDMAKEMMNLAKEQILSQAQIAMGAHLKQSNMQVLELIK